MYKIKAVIVLSLIGLQAYGQNAIPVNSKLYTPKQLHEDIDHTLKKLEQIHPNIYKETPKDTVLKRFAALKAQITKPTTRFDFMNLLTPLALGLIHDGHNFTFPVEEEYNSYLQGGGKLFPIPVIIRDGRLFCNSLKAPVPFHAEILQINGTPAKQVVQRVLSWYTSESDEHEEAMFSDWFNTSYWQIFGGFDAYKILYAEIGNPAKKEITTTGLAENEIENIRVRANTAPYELEEIPALKAAIFKFNTAEVDLKELRKFCDSIFTVIQNKKYTNLIIDISKNSGGTTRANDVIFEYITDKPVSQLDSKETKVSKESKAEYVRGNKTYAGWFKWYNYLYYPIYIRSNATRKKVMTAKSGTIITQKYPPVKPADNPLKFKGKLYLITGVNTYSAANGMAAAFKCYKLGKIIGQETGQPTVGTADWADFTLPNTGVRFAVSISRFTWACGKDDGHGVIPDYYVDPGDQSAGYTNREMDFAQQLIKKNLDTR